MAPRADDSSSVTCMVTLHHFWTHNRSPGAGFTAVLLGFTGQSQLPRWGVGVPQTWGVAAAFGHSQPAGLACSELHPLPWPESDGTFRMLSWAPSPPLQHPSPGTGVSLVPAAACPCHRLQPRVGTTRLKGRKSFGVISVLSPGSAFPPAHSLHQQENCLFLTLIKP